MMHFLGKTDLRSLTNAMTEFVVDGWIYFHIPLERDVLMNLSKFLFSFLFFSFLFSFSLFSFLFFFFFGASLTMLEFV